MLPLFGDEEEDDHGASIAWERTASREPQLPTWFEWKPKQKTAKKRDNGLCGLLLHFVLLFVLCFSQHELANGKEYSAVQYVGRQVLLLGA